MENRRIAVSLVGSEAWQLSNLVTAAFDSAGLLRASSAATADNIADFNGALPRDRCVQ